MAEIKDFSTSCMKAFGLNQAYMMFKLRNNYYILLICYFWTDKWKQITAKQKVYTIFFHLDNPGDY